MEGKSEIAAIPNIKKDTLDDLINSTNTEFPDQPEFLDRPEFIDKEICNMRRFKSASPSLSEEDY